MDITNITTNTVYSSPVLRNNHVKPQENITVDPGDIFLPDSTDNVSETSKLLSGMSAPSGSGAPWIKSQRPAELIGISQDGKVTAKNVRWGFKEIPGQAEPDPIFKNTTIDPSKLKNVYMVIEPFAPEWIAAHGMMCFEFNDGGVVAADGSKDDRLVLSIEARLKEGMKYSLIDGMKKKFTNVYQLGTWKDSVYKRSKMQGHKMISYPLNLSQKQKEQLLRNSLDKSFEDHSGDYYHTISNSCYNNQLRLLNTVLPPEQRFKEWSIPGILHKAGSTIPNFAGSALNSKGLLGGETIITQPDAKLFPDKQKKLSGFGSIMRRITGSDAWHVLPSLTGLLSGVALGTLLLPPGLGTVVGGLIGGFTGEKAGKALERTFQYKTEPAEKYYD